jgi:glycosyltransferase involved in cell wall biosynthesis
MISAITFIYWPEEKEFLESSLKSLAFCDEIIVIDNGAPEEVVKIAKKYTGKIYKSNDLSFAARHNLGKEKANGDWLLYIDSDERVSLKLAEEIKNLDNKFDAYQIMRIDYRLGKNFKTIENITRLFKRSKLINWTGDIHESSQVDGKIGKLSAPLYHLTHRDIFSMVSKTINFSEREALLRLNSGHPPIVWWRLFRILLTEFVNQIRSGCWRHGTEGWIDSLLQTFSMFIVYARLWELQQSKTPIQKYKEIDEKILSEGV